MNVLYALGFCLGVNGHCEITIRQNSSWTPDPLAYCENLANEENRTTLRVSGAQGLRAMEYQCFQMTVPAWSSVR